MNVVDFEHEGHDHVFGLIYGGSGTGKTHLMGTVAELGTMLLIDIDQGYLTIKNAKDIKPFHDNITVCSFDKFEDLDTAFKLIEANDVKKWNAFFKAEVITKPFDWIVWDTWSEIQWFMMQKLRANEGLSGVGINFRKNVQIQHWGSLTDLNKLAIQSLRDCKVNQLFTMQEAMMKDELSGQVYGGPAIHGKLVQEFPAFFDVVVYTYTDLQGKFCARTKPKGKMTAKTRLGEGQEFVNPTAKQLFT